MLSFVRNWCVMNPGELHYWQPRKVIVTAPCDVFRVQGYAADRSEFEGLREHDGHRDFACGIQGYQATDSRHHQTARPRRARRYLGRCLAALHAQLRLDASGWPRCRRRVCRVGACTTRVETHLSHLIQFLPVSGITLKKRRIIPRSRTLRIGSLPQSRGESGSGHHL